MNRYIKLEDLQKFPIRKNHYDKKNGSEIYVFGVEDVLEYAECLPTVDAVEVVRCKDCKWWKRMNGDKRLQCFHNHGLIRTTENDYCSRGERREE